MTRLLYDEDAYLTEFEASVISCEKTDIGYDVILDKTAFFPEEGGQKSDTGIIANTNVIHVRIQNRTVIHTVDSEVTGRVKCKIDSAPRFDKMQQHTGEHIVCGIVHEKYGYNNVGFHLADDIVTFDFDGPLSKSELSEIEILANAVVHQNRSVKCYYPADLNNIDYRSKLALTENVRIVEIDGVDKCACCAPHVKSTGEVGIIKFTDAIAYKGGVRITMVCGMRALADYNVKSQNLSVISKSLSAPINETAEYFEKFVSDVETLKQSLSALKNELITLKARTVITDGDAIVFEQGLESDMLRRYVNLLSEKCDGVCAVMSENVNGYTFVAASNTVDMRGIANELRQKLNAKCGGSDKMIQGSIPAGKNDIINVLKKR